MRRWEALLVALASLRAHKLRTFLTVLGNIVAVTSVIAVVSLIDGADRYVRKEVADEGSNVLTLRSVDEFQSITNLDAFLESLHNPDITIADYRSLRENPLPGIERVAAFTRSFSKVEAEGRSLGGILVEGWTADYPFFLPRGGREGESLLEGRHFSLFEEIHSRPVCVVGSEIPKRVLRGERAVGRTIRVNGRHLEIVGVFKDRPTVLDNDPNRIVMMPLGQQQKIFGGGASLNIRLQVADLAKIDRVNDEIRSRMRIRHRLRPAEKDDFAVTSSERIIALWQSISQAIFSALILLVAISLVVGGVVIMNVMLVSVTERTREVGLRKAIGARREDILAQFLAESVVISLAGGVLGTLLGFVVAVIVSWLTPLPYAVEPWAIFAGLAVTFGVGIFFGIYPANRAASLDPVEALRRE